MSILAGTIVSEPILIKKDKYEDLNFLISVERNSGVKDILEVKIPSFIKNNLKLNDKVSLVGQVTSYNEYEGEKRKLKLFFLVKEIKEYIKDINDIEINGIICSKIKVRETPLKRQCADVTIAHNSKNHSNYVPCILWGNCAINSSISFKIGDPVKVLGRFQSRPYTKIIDETPIEKIAYELSISKIFNINSENNQIDVK